MKTTFLIIAAATVLAVKVHAAPELSGDCIVVTGADRDKDDFERVTVHLKYYSNKSETDFDVVVYAKNEISIVHSKDRTKLGINACEATKSNNITLVYVKNHLVIVAPHANDWLQVGDQGSWYYISKIDDDSTGFTVQQYREDNADVKVATSSVFK